MVPTTSPRVNGGAVNTLRSARATRRLRVVAARVLPRPLKRFLKRRISSLRAAEARQTRAGGSAPSHIPADHARQVHSHYYIGQAMTGPDAPHVVLDLGCGDGASAELFRKWQPDVHWIGVDIEQSDAARAIGCESVVLYDGVNLPFPDNSLPLIYTNQVFEHVRYPESLLREIQRVLTPGGVFIGSTSQLEPYHSRSLWGGYTLYGWRTLCTDVGLVLEEARPSIDAIALITRQYEGALPHHNLWWQGSPLNAEIDAWAERTGADVATTNERKLQFCGQFAFRVRKPAAGGPPVRSGPPRPASSRMARARRRAGNALVRVGLRLAR
jgi:SAM-dependent methyltransferase